MKIIKQLLTIMFLSFAWITYAQVTVGIPDTTVTGSGSINIPIKVTNFNHIGAISLKIKYDPAVMTFQEVPSPLPAGLTNPLITASNGVVSIGWYGITALNLGNSTLMYLKFAYNGNGGTSALTFIKTDCDIADSLANSVTTAASFKDGSFTGLPAPRFINLASVKANDGDTVRVPLTIDNLGNVGSLSLKIAYNTSVLTYVSLEKDSAGFTSNAVGGTLGLSWYSTQPLKVKSGKLADLVFVFKTGTSALTFNQALCEVSDTASVIVKNITYTDGKVYKDISVEIGNVRGNVNSDVAVPVKINNITKIGSISMKVNFDPALLTYKQIKNFVGDSTAILSNAANGVLTISYSAPTTSLTIVNGKKAFDLVFNYKSGATASIAVNAALTEITDSSSPAVIIQGIIYSPGSISINKKPKLDTIAAKTVNENALLTFTVNAVDPESDPIVYKATGLPIGATFAADTKTITWTPTYTQGQIAPYIVKFFATDSIGAIDSATASITVKDVYRPPTFTSVWRPTDSVFHNITISFKYVGVSNEGKVLKYKVVKGPAGMVIDSLTGLMSWTPTFEQRNTSQIIIIGIYDTLTYVVTDSIKAPVSFTGVFNEPGIPTRFSLSQNYPNPFNPATNIKYSLDKPGYVSLKIYDAIGREVITLINGYKEAGNYSINFDGGNLSSGVYLYRLKSNGLSDSRKMILTK